MKESLTNKLKDSNPFALLDEEEFEKWIAASEILDKEPGEKILRADEMNSNLYLVLQGEIRLIDYGDIGEGAFTLGKRGSGQLIGWVSLLRGEATENIIASTNVKLLGLPGEYFVKNIKENKKFGDYFGNLVNPHEIYKVGAAAQEQIAKKTENWHKNLALAIKDCRVITVPEQGEHIIDEEVASNIDWYMSSAHHGKYKVGTIVESKFENTENDRLKLPRRLVGIPRNLMDGKEEITKKEKEKEKEKVKEIVVTSLEELGIIEGDNIDPRIKYPSYKAKSKVGSVIAACEMLSEYCKIPFKKDIIKKIIEGHIGRDKKISEELIAGLNEYLGLSTQIAEVLVSNIEYLEVPAQFCVDEVPIMIWEIKNKKVTLGDSVKGLRVVDLEDLRGILGESGKFIISKRTKETQTTRFGWSWFTPLVKKYKKPLALVFAASLLAQLFGLAIPLLLQQIIDKVLSQGISAA